MPTPEEKQRRKEIKRRFKQRERADFEAGLPLPKPQLRALFDYLDQALGQGCDQTLRLTREFLRERGLPEEPTTSWLVAQGGGCDCEVLANVEDRFS